MLQRNVRPPPDTVHRGQALGAVLDGDDVHGVRGVHEVRRSCDMGRRRSRAEGFSGGRAVCGGMMHFIIKNTSI